LNTHVVYSATDLREGGREGEREGGVGGLVRKICYLEIETYGCQNDGIDEADTMGRVGGREGREGGRGGGREDVPHEQGGG